MEINFTYVNLGLVLLFLCNLGSICGHFIRFCGLLFVLCCFLRKAKQDRLLCAASTHKSLPHQSTAHRFAIKVPNPQGQISLSSLRLVMGIAMRFFVGKILGSFGRNLTCAQETWWIRVSWSTRTFNMRSPHWLISNTAHAQSVDYLRLERVMFCRAILISPPRHPPPPL